MDTSKFGAMVESLGKTGEDILASLTPEKVHAWHMASCIPGEGGELFDAVKKWVIYNKPLDRHNVVEELGDLEFYMEGLRAKLRITREETLQANMTKLAKRYGDKFEYSDAAARDRADKVPVASVETVDTSCGFDERKPDGFAPLMPVKRLDERRKPLPLHEFPASATYDPEAGAVYIYLEPRQDGPSFRRVAVTDATGRDWSQGIHLDYARNGRLIGIEILSLTKVPPTLADALRKVPG